MAEQGLSYTVSQGSDAYESLVDHAQFPAIINLNVGGRNFTTHLSTLTKDPKSKLAAIFSGRHSILTKDQDGRYFIDVDGDMFAHVLNYLRFEKLPPADAAVDVYEYAVYFGIQSLVEEMKVFESVIHHVYLEKIKAFYPNYREYLAKIAEKIANVNNSMPIHNYDKRELKIHIFDETKCSRNQRNLYYRPHHEDKDGKHLMNLIQAELYKRGSYVDISKTNVDYFELRLNSTNQFSQAHKTDEKNAKRTASSRCKHQTHSLIDHHLNSFLFQIDKKKAQRSSYSMEIKRKW